MPKQILSLWIQFIDNDNNKTDSDTKMPVELQSGQPSP